MLSNIQRPAVAKRQARVRACGPPQMPGSSHATSTATSPRLARMSTICRPSGGNALPISVVPAPPVVSTIVPRVAVPAGTAVMRSVADAAAIDGQLTTSRRHWLVAGEPAGHPLVLPAAVPSGSGGALVVVVEVVV